jgi:hypothetical protein
MKRPLMIFLVFMICLILPPSVFSQKDTTVAAGIPEEPSVPGTWEMVVSGGWTFPFEPAEFKDYFKTNYNFGGGLAYAFAPGTAGYGEVSLLLHYYNVLFTHTGFRTAFDLPSNTNVYGYQGDVFTGLVNFRGVFASSKGRIAPYFSAGVGFFHVALPGLGIVGSTTPLYEGYKKSAFCWSTGLGVDIPVMDRFKIFVDGNFVLGVTETNGHKLFAAGGGVRYTL